MAQNTPENEWGENLPPNCPPELAIAPKHEIFYRLVKQFPKEYKAYLVRIRSTRHTLYKSAVQDIPCTNQQYKAYRVRIIQPQGPVKDGSG